MFSPLIFSSWRADETSPSTASDALSHFPSASTATADACAKSSSARMSCKATCLPETAMSALPSRTLTLPRKSPSPSSSCTRSDAFQLPSSRWRRKSDGSCTVTRETAAAGEENAARRLISTSAWAARRMSSPALSRTVMPSSVSVCRESTRTASMMTGTPSASDALAESVLPASST